ncbi:restriction endonuclease subunit S [Leptospira kirschneri]|uniref:restriction endonuclease subunit S n=1 Tax=Leptospira kirschneri TaxID=29507 RepID=UPI0002784A4C|nr:restriction endonuclease subunit S [Leptospira kirschneri]EJO68283.1 type I restriction modification DNA specificity domain protein [Leptospira kirschneri serovar Grippotyphosa str. RM52]EMK02769.1 type I restriction modification DNA specificity domain protein [Leptospira kirschneri str. MMD1493]UZW35388.1 restriction endonuclease subunit S [Leptospira kirschneri]WBF93762.1 restriction endonuclease subunit S [Leptospira kirschneri]WHO99095.1 restriction endonuclease subunit S [Leptospira ki
MSQRSFLDQLLDGAKVEWKALGEVIISNTGGGTPSKAKPEYWNGEIPWASVGDLSIDGHFIKKTRNHVTSEGLKDSSSNLISKGDVIVAVKISPGKMKIAGIDLAINQDLRGLKLKDEISAKFLNYYFQILILQGTGTIVKAITSKDLEKIQIPIPSLHVQIEIVRILDAFTELTAELTARKKQYNYYRDQLLSFEEGEVEWKTLGDVAEIRRGTAITEKETTPGNVPVIANAPNPIYFHNKSNRDGETIVIARSGAYAGLVSYWNQAYFLTDAFSIHADDAVIKPKFVYHLLKREQEKIHQMSKGGGVPHVRARDFEAYQIPIPSLAEQERIVAILDKFDALTSSISEGLPREIELRQKQYEYYRELLLSFPKPDGTK